MFLKINQPIFMYHRIDYQWGMKMEGQNPFGHNGVHDVTTVKPKYLIFECADIKSNSK